VLLLQLYYKSNNNGTNYFKAIIVTNIKHFSLNVNHNYNVKYDDDAIRLIHTKVVKHSAADH